MRAQLQRVRFDQEKLTSTRASRKNYNVSSGSYIVLLSQEDL